MDDLEITKLCAEAMGLYPHKYNYGKEPFENSLCGVGIGGTYDPLHDDAQAMALEKRFSLHIHHHGCADAKASLVTVEGMWLPYTQRFKVCTSDLNRAICECVAKMQTAK